VATPEPGQLGQADLRPGLREPLLTFAVVTALASALYWIGRVVPLVGANLHAAIAFLFLTGPSVAARLSRRPFDYTDAGLRLDPMGTSARVLGLALAVAFPLFLVAFLIYYGVVCGALHSPHFGALVDLVNPQCAHWRGLGGARLRLPPDFLLGAATQLLVVAIPEELFFRGYLQGRLDDRWPPRWRLGRAQVGPGWLLTSVLFALGHVLVDFNPGRLAVFFPGLVFGWMRARTTALAAGALFHALCNLYSDILHTSFF
jgi:membrane protease YdiL (CAAX protease family)